MRSRLFWITTSGLLSAVLAAPASWGADNASAKPKVKKGLSPTEARAVLRDLQELAEAAKADSASKPAGDLKNVERPERTVTPPKITSRDIDQMLSKHLAAEGAKPVDPADDQEFARRVWLDVTGTLPSPEEVLAFVNDKDAGKRAKLVERLLKDENFGATGPATGETPSAITPPWPTPGWRTSIAWKPG